MLNFLAWEGSNPFLIKRDREMEKEREKEREREGEEIDSVLTKMTQKWPGAAVQRPFFYAWDCSARPFGGQFSPKT